MIAPRVVRLIVALGILLVPAAYNQEPSGEKNDISAGSITNAEGTALTEHANDALLEGQDAGLRAFTKATNTNFDAGTFYRRISNTPMVQEDETLRILNERVLYGEALACRNSSCHVVFIRPISQIAHHWLSVMQRAFAELEEAAGSSTSASKQAGIKFVSELKSSDKSADSVWTHLATLYCNLEPDGKYTDLDGVVIFCQQEHKESR